MGPAMNITLHGAPKKRQCAAARFVHRGAAIIAAAILIVSCAHREGGPKRAGPSPPDPPEVYSDDGMVSSGSEEATRAGVHILELGGNAVDAAVAAAFALGVSDPGGSGLGGMTYVLISPANRPAIAIDGSATVPFAADAAELLELWKSGEYMGAKAVAVPATVAALSHALEHHGTMTLEEVLRPSIEIADRGFRLSHNSILWTTTYLNEILTSRYFRFIVLSGGQEIPSVGDRLCRPGLAATLRQLASEGPDAFYRGTIARRMLADLASRGGYLRPIDLASARATEIRPLRSTYRGAEVISYPLPGGGGEVARALAVLENIPRDALREVSLDRTNIMLETFRIAHADFARIASNPMHQAAGPDVYLFDTSARDRADLITPGRAIPEEAIQKPSSRPRMGEHTTHLSVADRWGNAVALSQTLCRQYGAKVATPGLGFPYNSCLEFFDFEDPESPFHLHPRARYSTAMAPTIVRQNGELMVLGSAGSDRIPGSVTEVISNVIDRRMGIRDAVIAPRVLWNSAHDPPRVCIELTDQITDDDADTLQSYGFEHMFRLVYTPIPVPDSGFFGGVNALLYDPSTGKFSGIGDPRRSGFAAGPRAVAEPQEIP
jgi:gamma-glutamyltranspeptidase/glutathione hydrolase